MTSSHRRHDISDRVWARLEPHLPGRKGELGRGGQRQPPVYQCGVLDFAHRGALARFAARLRRLEPYSPAFHPLASSRCVGHLAGELG